MPIFRPSPLGAPCHEPSLAPPQCSPPARSRTFRTTSRQPSPDPVGRGTLFWWHWPVSSTTLTPSRSRPRAWTQSRNSSTSGRPACSRSFQLPTYAPPPRKSASSRKEPLPPCARLVSRCSDPFAPGNSSPPTNFQPFGSASKSSSRSESRRGGTSAPRAGAEPGAMTRASQTARRDPLRRMGSALGRGSSGSLGAGPDGITTPGRSRTAPSDRSRPRPGPGTPARSARDRTAANERRTLGFGRRPSRGPGRTRERAAATRAPTPRAAGRGAGGGGPGRRSRRAGESPRRRRTTRGSRP